MYRILKAFAFLVLSFLVSPGCQKGQIEAGDDAPDFSLKDIDGQEVKLRDYRGKIVLVHFWVDCCADLNTGFPRMQAMYEKLHSGNFELLAVNAGQPKNLTPYYADKYDITFPMLIDEMADVAVLYKIHSAPTNFMISEQGKVMDVLVGWPSQEYIQDIISSIHRRQQER